MPYGCAAADRWGGASGCVITSSLAMLTAGFIIPVLIGYYLEYLQRKQYVKALTTADKAQ